MILFGFLRHSQLNLGDFSSILKKKSQSQKDFIFEDSDFHSVNTHTHTHTHKLHGDVKAIVYVIANLFFIDQK